MRASLTDLPLILDRVSLSAGATTMLDRVNLAITPGAPTLVLGPNGAGKTSLL
ncbi:MAG: ATP-binding cassette domain-containing protein, partial [Mesorhizobium sp.]